MTDPYSHRPVLERILRETLSENEFDIDYDPATFFFTITRKSDGVKIRVDKQDVYVVSPSELPKALELKFEEAENGTGTF